MEQEKEIWKDIKGFEGKYMVSNLSNIKSVNYNNNGFSKNLKNPTVINVYHRINLYIEGKRNTTMIHRIVAEAFIPNPDNKPCVNHINGMKHDNRIDNLEWVTYSENGKHAYDTNLKKPYLDRGENIKSVKKANSKKIIDTKTNIVYDSIRSAAESIMINPSSLYSYLSGRNFNKTNFKFYENE